MIPAPLRSPPHSLLVCLCFGVAAANVLRLSALAAAAGIAAAALLAGRLGRTGAVACALAIAGCLLGSVRLAHLDRSVLLARVGTAERARVVLTAPPRRSRFDLKLAVRVRRFGELALDEPAQLELPLGRSPPQGAILDVRAEVKLPRGPRHGFDERTWLRRHGIHVVLAGDDWRVLGHRGGLGGFGDSLRLRVAEAVGSGLDGERRAVVLGVVLGDDASLSRGLRDRFRASGLYHLL
jgi:predicted membrane metal-binding protein